jgi:hypothetical protein
LQYDTEYLSFGFTNIDVDGEERPQYLLCMKILVVDSIKLDKLKCILKQCMLNMFGKHLNFPIEKVKTSI